MSNFKILTSISIILFFGSLTLNADETKKTTTQTNTDKKPVSIRFVPGYKKHDRETGIEDTYKRAIIIEIDDASDEKTLQKMASDQCLKYNLKQRQNYFVNFVKGKKAKVEKTILCSTFDEPMLKGAFQGSTFDTSNTSLPQ